MNARPFVHVGRGLVHGTESAYRKHRCRCDECRAHRSVSQRRWRERKRLSQAAAREQIDRSSVPPRRVDWIPADRIWPIVAAWISAHDVQPAGGFSSWPIAAKPKARGGLAELALVAGLDANAIWRIRRCHWITFTKADRLLSAMDLNHLWHTDLADLYYEVAV
jgi:hypothetical protein